jgi:lipoprotein-releasing system permease protein
MIVGKGLLIGDIWGIGLCFIQKYCSIVKLDPSTYYIDSVPIEMNWVYILLINMGVLLMSSLVIFGSSFLMSIKGPSSTIRWE